MTSLANNLASNASLNATTNPTANPMGMLHFIHQADAVAWLVLAVLVAMSVCSWFIIVKKTWQLWRIRSHGQTQQQYLDNIQQAPTLTSLALQLQCTEEPSQPLLIFTKLAAKTLTATQQHIQAKSSVVLTDIAPQVFLENVLARALDEARAKLEEGQTVLASVASCAPFVGLFGTVWGIYHALVRIGSSGQASLDQVAGPVGEALIMTALGLAVAIPALLAYNAFARSQRTLLHQLEGFAHDLFGLMCTGHKRRPLNGEQSKQAHVGGEAIVMKKTRGSA